MAQPESPKRNGSAIDLNAGQPAADLLLAPEPEALRTSADKGNDDRASAGGNPGSQVSSVEHNVIEPVKSVSLSGLYRYATPADKALVILGSIGAIAYGLCQPITMLLTGQLFDAFGTVDTKDASRIASYFAYVAVVVIIGASTMMICFNTVANRLTNRVQIAFFDAVLKHSVAYIDAEQSKGSLNSIAAANISLYQAAVGLKLGMAIHFTTTTIASFIIGYVKSWQIALVVTAFFPLIGFGGYYYGVHNGKTAAASMKAYAGAGAVVDEAFGSIRTVTALNMQDHFVRKMRMALKPVIKVGRKSGLLAGLGFGLLLFGYQVSFSPSFYMGAILVTNTRENAFKEYPLSNPPPNPNCSVGSTIPLACSTQPDNPFLTFQSEVDVCNCALCQCGCYAPDGSFHNNRCITGGDVLLVFFSVIIAGAALGHGAPFIIGVRDGRASAAKIFEIIDSAPGDDVIAKYGRVIDKKDVKGEIRFENAVFSYPTRKDITVLQNTNIVIPAGKRLAICGVSGSGKSSIVSLILRFYDLQGGCLLLDGVDVKELNVASIRDCIGLVSQEPVLFAGVSIRDNVRYGMPEATDDQVEEACKMANAHDFIMRFPQNYDTVLVGSSLSGGQKQRIAIARALIRDPRILILDEASAALDSESERHVNEAIGRVVSNTKRTVIVVAHRLSTIRTCETIIMMGSGGKVLEEGTHDELMALNGAYYAMNMAAEKQPKEESRSATQSIQGRDSEDGTASSGDPDMSQVTSTLSPSIEKVDESVILNQYENQKKERSVTELKKDKPKPKSVPLARVFKFAYPERFWFIPALICSAINGAIDPFLAFTFARVIPSLYYMNNEMIESEAVTFAWAFFGIGCLKGLVNVIAPWSWGIISAEMTSRVRVETFKHLLRMEMGFFDEPEHNVGAMSQILARDAGNVKSSVGDLLSVVATVSFAVITGIIIAFIATWKLSLVVFALFPLLGIGFIVENYIKTATSSKEESESAAAQTFSEALSGFRTVCAFNLRETLVRLYCDQIDDSQNGEQRKTILSGFVYGLSQSVVFFSYAIMFYYSSVLLRDGEITFQNMLQALLTIVFTASNTGGAFAMSPDLSKGGAAVRSVFGILDRPSKIDPSEPSGLKPSTVIGNLQFRAVSFSYPSRKQYRVLKSFEFDIPRGTVLALVGESGSGKSTIVQLLERFYDPDEGKVLIDGNQTKDLNVQWLRSQIGLVSQEPTLFDDSIYNNIQFGLTQDILASKTKDEVKEMIEKAAKDANAHDFIMQLPNQYGTSCGSKGSQLSGGQKQRIAIARALVRDPNVLLCDEATSALDEESQRTVQDALDRLLEAKKRTVIIIAHRLTTIQRADVILVLRNGEIVETGTFDVLSKKETGYFRALLQSQGTGGNC